MKILFIQLGRIGDMLLLTPLFRAVKEKYPDALIDIIASRRNYNIIINNPNLNDIIIYEKSPVKFLNTIRKVRKNFYDYYIDPKDHFSRESKLFAKVIRAGKKIGFNTHDNRTFDYAIPSDIENIDLHCTRRFFNSLKPLSILNGEKVEKPELFTIPDSDEYVENYLIKQEFKNVILVNISATMNSRMFSTSKWISILNECNSGKNFIVLYAPEENTQAEELKKSLPFLNLFPSRSIQDVVSIVKRADSIITVDTALVHIASAFNIPIFCFFIGNEEQIKKYHPLSDVSVVMKSADSSSEIELIDNIEIKSNLKEFLNFAKLNI